MNSKLSKEFQEALLEAYHRAKNEVNYNATRFIQMLSDYGGVGTAKILINAPTVSDGYTAMYLRKRLDLTVEALIYDNPRWQSLFSEEELITIQKRLAQYKYKALR